MCRLAILLLSISCALASLSCSSYSGGLVKTASLADEAGATGTLHTIALAQQSYSVSNSGSYATFQQLSDIGLLDSRFSAEKPSIKDYVFTMDAGKDGSGFYYKINADPKPGVPSGRHFYLDSSSDKLHVNPTQAASATDPEY